MIIKTFIKDLKILLSSPIGCFNLIIGLFWVSFYVFIRLFRDITGYKIIELKGNISIFVYIFFLFFVIINFSILLFYVVDWYKIKFNKKTSVFTLKFVNWLRNQVNLFFWVPLDSLYKLVNVPGSGKFFLFLEKNYFMNPWRRDTSEDRGILTYVIIFSFDILPKIVLSVVFFIEVILFGQVFYFLRLLPILFLPIILKISIKLMESFGIEGVTVTSEYFLEVRCFGKKKEIYNSFDIFSLYEVRLKSQYINVVDPQVEQKFILKCQNILMQAYFVKREQAKFVDIISIITSVLYLTAGVVRFYLICL